MLKAHTQKNKIKQTLMSILCLLLVLFTLITPMFGAFADDDEATEDGEKKIKSGLSEYEDPEGDGSAAGLVGQLYEEDNPQGDPETFAYVMWRLFAPGYMNDLSRASIAKDLKEQVGQDGINKDQICYEYPQNLLNHNCDIPNFMGEFVQSLLSISNSDGVQGSERTTAQAMFGLGRPKGIPGGRVPVVPSERSSTYTALELFGYNLHYTKYNGEWDKITVSTEARLLSNFGTMDKFVLAGKSLWGGITTGLSSLIKNFEWNPLKWGQVLRKTLSAAAAESFNTILDTSDFNTVASYAWHRDDQLAKTLYNVYVLTDKEVVMYTAKDFMNYLIAELMRRVEADPELIELSEIGSAPEFTYDPNWETDESVAARTAAEEQNARHEDCQALPSGTQAEKDAKAACLAENPKVTVPDPIPYTYDEQLDFWRDDNSTIIEKAKKHNIKCADKEIYEQIVACWSEGWENQMKAEFNVNSKKLRKWQAEIESQYKQDFPYSDPNRAISHYACADENGGLRRDSSGSIMYVYKSENKDNQEFLTPECSPVRPSVSGGYFGAGWKSGQQDMKPDTRRTAFTDDKIFSFMPFFGDLAASIASGCMKVSAFIAQLTNELLGLAFSPLLDELGITMVVEELISSLRDTIFFPLIALAAMCAAIYFLFSVIRTQALSRFFMSVGAMLLIFVIGVALLTYPEKTIKLVDEVPTEIDNAIMNMFTDDDESSICTTGDGGYRGGIRTAQCNVWQMMVFNPWVAGQWGTSYNNLYAAGTSVPANGAAVTNTNTSLVGNAEVNMGGGRVINNWPLYQLQETKSGTMTTPDFTNPTGSTSRDMYRIVDMMAGPDGGAASDGRWLETWSNGSGRAGIAFLSIIMSVIGLIVIGGLAFMKIELSLVFAIYLIFLPIMLLIGVGGGQLKLKKYSYKMLSLFVKRLFITLFLCILLRVVNAVATTGAAFSFFSVFLITIVLLLLFKMYLREFLNFFNIDPDNVLQGSGMMSSNSEEIRQAMQGLVPRHLTQQAAIKKAQVKGAAIGAVVGAIGGSQLYSQLKKDGLLKAGETRHTFIKANADKAGKQAGQTISGMAQNQARRDGHSNVSVVRNAKTAVINEGAGQILESKDSMSNEVYRQMLYDSKYSDNTDIQAGRFAKEDFEGKAALQDAEVQRMIREEAKHRRTAGPAIGEDGVISGGKNRQELTQKFDQNQEKKASMEAVKHPTKKPTLKNMEATRAANEDPKSKKYNPVSHKTSDIDKDIRGQIARGEYEPPKKTEVSRYEKPEDTKDNKDDDNSQQPPSSIKPPAEDKISTPKEDANKQKEKHREKYKRS